MLHEANWRSATLGPVQGFEPLPAQVDLPALEREVLARWQDAGIFERSLKQTEGGPSWIFYEGPPTANGLPGVHHVEARTFKDLFPRFKTMQGFHVPRKGGWDCHGLPVEVAVEKELGFTGKRDIEAYGIAAFNARCRESVLRYVDAWLAMSWRMGYWADTEHAYRTMDASYVESVWWSLKAVFDAGLLARDFRISPYCPRCGTPLSDAELGQPDVYQPVSDPAITVRFRLLTLPDGAPPQLDGADLLVWTTTPWTLVSNTAVAVHPEACYVVARHRQDGDRVVVAEDLVPAVLGEGWQVSARFPGEALVGASYRAPFGIIDIPDAHVVIPGSFVTTEDGTGLVHLAPAFGADDMDASRAHGLPVVNPVKPDGHFEDGVPLVGGLFFKDADQRLINDLDDRGLLFAARRHEHSYPHCWRCGTALLYYALPSWYIRTTAIKDRLLVQNEQTNWYPATVKYGRYGEWLRNNVDWALSRTRYWGTPLPLWVCDAEHVTCVGSLAELSERAGQDLTGLDPHRPFVDEIAFACPQCGERARRVPEVIDVWYDSGAMPFAQHGAPLRNRAEFEAAYPAQFICEALDQTRGWFYSLMAVGTLVFGRSSYENVVCVGLLVDETGRKMSKHLGNVLEPIPLMDAHGADALRWFFAASGSPWGARRVGHDLLSEIVRKVLLTYWNTASFLVLYANAGGWRVPDGLASAPAAAQRPVLDRWVLGELHAVVRDVTASLEGFDTAAAGRRLATFVDDLSNWYVRRSRRRFWNGPASDEGAAAFATLYECLTTLTLLMAPFTPFITDYVLGRAAAARGGGLGAPGLVARGRHSPNRSGTDRSGAVRADGAGAAAGRAGTFGSGGRLGPYAAAAAPGPDRSARVLGVAWRAAGADRGGTERGGAGGAGGFWRRARGLHGQAELPLARPPVRGQDAGRGGRRHRGSGRGDRDRRAGRADGCGDARGVRRRAGADRRRRRDRDPDAAGGLGGGHGRRRDRGDRHHRQPGIADRRARARGHPAGPGGQEERRPGYHRPDLAALVVR